VYYPVRAMLSGVNPYYTTSYLEAFPVRVVFPLYSPGVLLVNLPFGLLPCELSAIVFFTASVALIPVLAILILSVAGLAPGLASTVWLSVFIAAGRPLYANLTLGQTALPIAVGIVLALHFARRRPGWGGVGLA